MTWSLGHGHAMSGRVATGHEVLELSLDVGEKRAGTDAEQIRFEPAVTQLVLHEVHVLQDVLCAANSSGRLEADGVTSLLVILADHSSHDERESEGRVDALFACRGLDEVGPRLHGDDAGPSNVVQCRELAGREYRFHARFSAGVAEGLHFLVQRLPVTGEHVRSRNDNVDFARTGGDTGADLVDTLLQRTEARGKAGGNGGDGDRASGQGVDGRPDERSVQADRADPDPEPGCAE